MSFTIENIRSLVTKHPDRIWADDDVQLWLVDICGINEAENFLCGMVDRPETNCEKYRVKWANDFFAYHSIPLVATSCQEIQNGESLGWRLTFV